MNKNPNHGKLWGFLSLKLENSSRSKPQGFTPSLSNRKLLILLVILILPSVLAVGVSPGRTNIDFTPSLEKKFEFSVFNSEKKNITLAVAVQGELSDYVFVNVPNFKMSSLEDVKKVSYDVRLPQELSPGAHTGEIVVLQLPEEGELRETYIGAAVAVITQVYVQVPYPGKYAEAEMNVVGPDKEGKMAFIIPVISRGDFDLVRVKTVIDIYSSMNEKIKTIESEEISIASGKRAELVATWDSLGIEPGNYKAVATVLYDEKTLSLEKTFNVGARRLKVENIKVNDFKLGDIAKFEILVKNEWSQEVEDVYAQMTISNKNGAALADFKSPSYNINSLEKTLMTAFWDTEGVREGTYDATLLLKYGDKAEKESLELEVKKDEIIIVGAGFVISKIKTGSFAGLSSPMTILITLVVILIITNISWFLFLRKRLLKK